MGRAKDVRPHATAPNVDSAAHAASTAKKYATVIPDARSRSYFRQ